MDELKIYDLAEEYADNLIDSDDFKLLKELSLKIEKELAKEIMRFKTSEAKYLEALEYGKYHPNLVAYQKEFVVAKTILYSNDLVKQYKELEQKIQNKLNSDLNDLKNMISNKFKLESIINISDQWSRI